jgi:hypothetical protein
MRLNTGNADNSEKKSDLAKSINTVLDGNKTHTNKKNLTCQVTHIGSAYLHSAGKTGTRASECGHTWGPSRIAQVPVE